MKYVKRLVAVAVAATTLFVGVAPTDAATEATTATLSGGLTLGTSLYPSGAWLGIGACLTGASAGSQPAAAVGTSCLSSSGAADGVCGLWSGHVYGSIRPAAELVGSAPRYDVFLSVTLVGSVLEISGTAVAPDGTHKAVVGSAVLVAPSGSECIPGTALGSWRQYSLTGSLTIGG